MRNLLFIVIGMGVMFLLLKILSAGSSGENSNSGTSQAFMALAKTGQALNLVKTNEFMELVKTPEFRQFVKTLAEDQFNTLVNTLAR